MSFSDFKSYNLSELYTISSGLSKNRKEFGFGYPFVTFKDIFDNYFLPEQLESFANTSDKERERCSVRKGDLFLTRTSETQEELGMSSVALKDYEHATFNGFTKRLRPKAESSKLIDPVYIAYYMRSSLMRKQINSLSIMTTRASLNNSMIEKLKIELPELKEQKAVSAILKILDNKVEVNNQINKTLENMAQAIFKQWFVDFEFPNEDGEPYKSSGGEMIESELGMIPKGWEVGDFSDVVEFIGGFSFMSKDYLETGKYKVITIKNVLDGKFDSSSVKYLDTIPEKMKDVQKLEKGDILMSLTGNVARVCIVSENDCLLNQRVAKIQEKSNFSRGYIYVLFRSQLVKEILLAIAKGTAQLNLSPVEAQKMKIIIPCDKVIDKISVIYDSLFNLLLQSTDEIKLLEKLRDSLLPKLMSGEIRVPLDEECDAS